MARIAVGGIQHETNTFAPSKADLAAFTVGDDLGIGAFSILQICPVLASSGGLNRR